VALSPAEKQRRYRERHLGYHPGKHGIECRKKRIQYFVSFHTWVVLDRLAQFHGCSMTKLIEHIVADAEAAVIRQIPGTDLHAYLKGELQRDGFVHTDVASTQPGEPHRRKV